ncbi:MAG: hypothetical protein O3A00_18035 [Planctomycetota bacterium]|nr:hypothetical protein [Planctomycetota bacterium]
MKKTRVLAVGCLCIAAMIVVAGTRGSLKAQESNEESKAEKTSVESPAAKKKKRKIPKEPQQGFEQYRVKVSVSFDNDPRFTGIYRDQMLDEIERVVDRTFGLMFQLTVEPNEWLVPARKAVLDRVLATEIQSAQGTGDFDKIFVVAIEADGVRYQASVREWDAHGAGRTYSENDGPREWDDRGRVFSPSASDKTTDRRDVAEVVGRIITKVFRPLLTVESADADNVRLRLKAGEFPAPDAAGEQIRPGDILLPYFRYKDKEMVVKMVQFLPATYIIVQEVDRSIVQGVIVSGLGMRIQGGKKRRIDQMCIRERPRHAVTEVQMVLRRNTKRLLIANRVRIVAKLRGRDEGPKDREPIEVWSDRHAKIPVSVDPEHSLVWLYVHSGKQLVSRVPFAPGLVAEQSVELLDDSLRLGVEGELTILQGRLVDTVARQAVLKAFIKKAADAEDWDKVDKELVKLKELMPIAKFKADLSNIRVDALEAARVLNDKVAKSRITSICSETEQLIDRYLDKEKMETFIDGIESQKNPAPKPGTIIPKSRLDLG